MSVEAEKIKLQMFFVQQGLVIPLVETRGLLNKENYEFALRTERGTIKALPDGYKELFDEDIKNIDYILDQSGTFEELDPIQFEILRATYLKKVGSKLATQVYDKLWEIMHDMGLFKFLDEGSDGLIIPAMSNKSGQTEHNRDGLEMTSSRAGEHKKDT